MQTKLASTWKLSAGPMARSAPHCGNVDQAKITAMKGKAHRHGLYNCKECREQFSVTVGTTFERSKIALNKWLLATYLMATSKKGMSAHQLHRMLGVTYKTAWFMAHRIRAAMTEAKPSPIGGQNKVVEADETFVGGKAKNRAYKAPPKKEAVMALVERGGEVRSYHVANVTAKTLRPIIVKVTSRQSHLMTDEAATYISLGREFAGHSRSITRLTNMSALAASPTPTQPRTISPSSSAA